MRQGQTRYMACDHIMGISNLADGWMTCFYHRKTGDHHPVCWDCICIHASHVVVDIYIYVKHQRQKYG